MTLTFVCIGVLSAYLIGFAHDAYVPDLEKRLEYEAHLINEMTTSYFENGVELLDLRSISFRLGHLAGARITL